MLAFLAESFIARRRWEADSQALAIATRIGELWGGTRDRERRVAADALLAEMGVRL